MARARDGGLPARRLLPGVAETLTETGVVGPATIGRAREDERRGQGIRTSSSAANCSKMAAIS